MYWSQSERKGKGEEHCALQWEMGLVIKKKDWMKREPGKLSRYSDGLQAGLSGVIFPARARDVSLHHNVQTGSGAIQPPIQWVPGDFPLGLKRPKREADRSPPSSAEVKNYGTIFSLPNTSSWRGV
jgi:hypothetical protein